MVWKDGEFYSEGYFSNNGMIHMVWKEGEFYKDVYWFLIKDSKGSF